MMKLTLKGSKTSGWYAPPEGTHSGEKHRAVGSGKAGGAKEKRAPVSAKRSIVPTQNASTVQGVLSDIRKDIADNSIPVLYGETTVSDVERKAIDNLRNHVDGKPICVNVPADIAHSILDSGKIMNQHETGTSGGKLDNVYRRDAELNAFEYGGAPSASDLPIYGYIDDGPRWAREGGEKYRASGYGDVTFVMKDSVRSRTTITVEDSLWGFGAKELVGTPLAKPGLEGIDGEWKTAYDRNWGNISYVEAQIHGGITLSDISRIIMRPSFRVADEKERAFALGDRAKALGIAVEWGV